LTLRVRVAAHVLRRRAGRPVHVSRYLAAFGPRFWPRKEIEWVEANGGPAALVSDGGTAVVLLTLDISERGIERAMWVMNPEKLTPYVASLGT
jgi:RNA polymerase sigma-70 factor, ECF subfamily